MAKLVTLMLNPSVDVMLEFDEFIKTKTNRVKNRIEHMGGKGLNVSFVAKSFGLEVCATGFIGADKAEELKGVLEDRGIENAFVCVDGQTRTNYKLMDRKEASVTEANGQGFSVSKEKIAELEETLKKSLDGAEILVLTGSIPNGVDEGFYARCIELANGKGIKTVLDSSGKALELAILQKPYAIKPNIDELSDLFGKPLIDKKEVAAIMNKLIDDGIGIVTVSMGAKGAMFADNEKIICAKTFEIEFKSAVGAGDSMVAAICYSIANNLYLEETARLSISAGCMTTSKTATNLCTADEVFGNKQRVVTSEMII